MNIKEILKMSASKRILLAQEIWDSVPENSIELSDSVKNELDNRLKIHNSNEMEYYTIDEVKNKLAAEK
jgi:putative addiction module component (TIGR02574 family)